jgi:UDP-N-acetylglucosamine:LPS N-acetylglucosamine transferase
MLAPMLARTSGSDGVRGDGPPRVLIVSADVGEGHLAAARALRESLSADGCAVGVHEDGLSCLGAIARHLIREGYRVQLQRAPWSYNLLYGAWHRAAPLRWLGARLLYRAGRRRLSRLIVAHRPDVVVSTHPALTAALGRMRRRGDLRMPLCVTISDLIDDPMWCHRGADLHVVMHPIAVPWVERRAGQGSALAVRSLVSSRFTAPRDRVAARRQLGLPDRGGLVVVSGGGWGVGELSDGVEAALAARADRVIALAGRNAALRTELDDRYAREPRVEVLDFTDRMPELLAAASVLVHGTGGMTSQEALACGCPLIASGTRLAHVERHNLALAGLGLCTIAGDPPALRDAIADRLAAEASDLPAPTWPLRAAVDAATAIRSVRPRVRPLPVWVLALQRLLATVGCAGVLLWTVATDDAFSLAAPALHLRPISHVTVPDRAVALVVDAPAAQIPALAFRLERAGLRLTFAVPLSPPPATVRALHRDGDDALPTLGDSGAIRWLATRDELSDAAHDIDVRDFLVSRGGISFGQDLLARSAGDQALAPERVLETAGSQAPLPTGGIVLVKVSGAGATRSLVAMCRRARAEGVAVQTVSALLASSTSARTAGERSSKLAAALTTATSPAASIHAAARP